MTGRERERARGARPLWLSWAALLVLLAATTGLAFVPLGALNLPVSLAIAVAKALVILAVFMELAKASQLTRVFAVAGFFWLGILLGLPAVDYLTRRTDDAIQTNVR